MNVSSLQSRVIYPAITAALLGAVLSACGGVGQQDPPSGLSTAPSLEPATLSLNYEVTREDRSGVLEPVDEALMVDIEVMPSAGNLKKVAKLVSAEATITVHEVAKVNEVSTLFCPFTNPTRIYRTALDESFPLEVRFRRTWSPDYCLPSFFDLNDSDMLKSRELYTKHAQGVIHDRCEGSSGANCIRMKRSVLFDLDLKSMRPALKQIIGSDRAMNALTLVKKTKARLNPQYYPFHFDILVNVYFDNGRNDQKVYTTEYVLGFSTLVGRPPSKCEVTEPINPNGIALGGGGASIGGGAGEELMPVLDDEENLSGEGCTQ